MFEAFVSKLRAINKLPDLRKKIMFTLIMFLVARVGTHIPAPGVDVARLMAEVNSNDILGFINMFSGGAFTKVSIFSLGVIPYINASIVFQLLTVIIPQLEEIQKEGDAGRQKIVQWTRYLTIFIGGIQAVGICVWLQSMGLVQTSSFALFAFTTTVILTAGTVFLMWLGEQITLNGIGNGISLIIFLNIISRLPSTAGQIFAKLSGDALMVPKLIFMIAFGLVIVVAIVMFQMGQRRIPVQYVGKGFSGKSAVGRQTYLPLKINTAGVMPIIFASVLLTIPGLLIKALPSSDVKVILESSFSGTHPVYLTFYALLVIFFTFFYTALMFDPEKVAENLKKSGGTIPGIRPGKETVEYLEKTVTRVTVGGSIFLAAIAVIPLAIFGAMKLPVFLGGTAVLIVVGVALDTIQQINANLVMRDYNGFIS